MPETLVHLPPDLLTGITEDDLMVASSVLEGSTTETSCAVRLLRLNRVVRLLDRLAAHLAEQS